MSVETILEAIEREAESMLAGPCGLRRAARVDGMLETVSRIRREVEVERSKGWCLVWDGGVVLGSWCSSREKAQLFAGDRAANGEAMKGERPMSIAQVERLHVAARGLSPSH